MDLTIILVHLCPGMQVEMKMADLNISNYQHLTVMCLRMFAYMLPAFTDNLIQEDSL